MIVTIIQNIKNNLNLYNININSKQKAPNLSIGKIIPIFGGSDKKMTKRIKKE